MSQIKKKFIADKAIDGSKILLQNNEALKALDSLGVEKSIMKFNSSNAFEFIEMPEITADPISGNQVVRKSYVDTEVSAEETRAMGEEARIEGKVDQEISDRQAAVSAEQSRAESAEAALDARLDTLEGADNVAGSVAKALKDAKDYSDQKISDLVNGAPGVLDTLKELSDALGGDENFAATLAGQMAGLDGRLDTLEGDETTSGSVAKALKDAKDYTDAEVSAEETRATSEEGRIEGRLDQYISDNTLQMQSLGQYVDAETARATGEEARIEGKIDQEISDRQTVENQLTTQITSAREYAEGLVLAEQGRAEGVEQELDTRIDEVENLLSQEVVNRTVAVSAEETRAMGEESRIEGKVDQEILDRQAAVSSEQSRAEAAESALDARLDTLEGADNVEGSVAKAEKDAKDYADGIMYAEQAARQASDDDLQGQINTEKGRIDAILLASDADKDSFAEIVTLINSVDTTNDSAFASYVLSNDAALAAEEARAEGEEQRIEGKVDQEISDRQAAVSAEQSARESADSALDARLDVLEGADTVSGSVAKALKDAKAYTDQEVSSEETRAMAAESALDSRLDVLEADPTTKAYVDGLIATEQDVRDAEITAVEDRLDILEGADTLEGSVAKAEKDAKDYADSLNSSMDSRVDALEAVQHRKESFTLASGDISSGYVELSMEAMASSTVVFVGRLGAIEGVDYSVSVISGKTRITWTGELASGGASALVVGDKVHVKFMK